MATQDPKHELKSLRAEQDKTRRNEIFGGLSPTERADYYRESDRIHELKNQIHANSAATTSLESAKAEKRRSWNKQSETDTPLGEAHQPYRSREEGSTGGVANSSKQRTKVKRVPREDDSAS